MDYKPTPHPMPIHVGVRLLAFWVITPQKEKKRIINLNKITLQKTNDTYH